jgi:hypothetical protein
VYILTRLTSLRDNLAVDISRSCRSKYLSPQGNANSTKAHNVASAFSREHGIPKQMLEVPLAVAPDILGKCRSFCYVTI